METTLTRRLAVAAAMLGASALLMTLVAAATAPPAHALEGGVFKKQIQKCKKKFDGKAEKKCIKKVKQQPPPALPVGATATSLTLFCTDCGPGNTHPAATNVQVAGDISPPKAGDYQPIRVDCSSCSSGSRYFYPGLGTGHYVGQLPASPGTVTATYPGSVAGNFGPSSATITIQPV